MASPDGIKCVLDMQIKSMLEHVYIMYSSFEKKKSEKKRCKQRTGVDQSPESVR